MNKYWTTTSTGYNPEWTTGTSIKNVVVIYNIKK